MAQALDPSFSVALQNTVSTILTVPVSAVINIDILETRRRLLASIIMMYSVSVNSGDSTEELITKLQDSVASGLFLRTLQAFSGLNITGVSGLDILGVTPTAGPTKVPNTLFTGKFILSFLYIFASFSFCFISFGLV